MIWEGDNARLALLEILSRGKLKRRRAQAEAYETLAELPWTRSTGRRNEIGVVAERRAALADLIDRVWPGWREALADLTAAGLPPTPDGYGRLLDRARASALPELPDRINRRTAAALTGPHSKTTLTESRQGALGEAGPTHDGIIRLRPPAGLSAQMAGGIVDLGEIAAILGEASIPERAFLDGLTFSGSVRAVLLVENLGAWRDLQSPDDWLVAHVPGWDVATAGHLLDRFRRTPIIHFGDLDPNGVRILLHLCRRAPHLTWFVPDFWLDRAAEFGRNTSWPRDLNLDFAPARVRELAARGLWLEQERIVLDGRMTDALEESLAKALHRLNKDAGGTPRTLRGNTHFPVRQHTVHRGENC